MEKSNFIWIKTQQEFIHNYPNAPVEVKFLRNLHRHMFHFKVYLEVKGNNRDVEFIMFKKDIEKYLSNLHTSIKSTSCEALCDYIYEHIKNNYKGRAVKIEVSEDNENGVFKEYK